MKQKHYLVVAALVSMVTVSEANVAKYAGQYDAVAVYTYGSQRGACGYGVATASRSGAVSRTLYWPHAGRSFSGIGRINSQGWFSFNDRLQGRVKIYNYQTGFGKFRDNTTGGGFFGVQRR